MVRVRKPAWVILNIEHGQHINYMGGIVDPGMAEAAIPTDGARSCMPPCVCPPHQPVCLLPVGISIPSSLSVMAYMRQPFWASGLDPHPYPTHPPAFQR